MTSDRHAKFMALLLGTASACAVLSSPAAAAEERQRFDIRAQDAAAALNEYARQAGVQIVFPYDRVRGKTAPDVQGDLTRHEALALLTDGMGLTVTSDTAGMVTLRDATDPQGGSAAGGGAEVEALIVTAQKREEDIQDVPIAISAFTQEDLTRQQIAGGPDLITQVPNMTFTKTNFSSYSVQLRGIGTQAISATTDPAVAVAFNNTPFIRNRFFEQEFYDLQRVEVLRGPQGTLYGRNATAGVVNIISQKPKFTAEAKLSGDLSNYSSSRLEGMVNVPLVDDVVALRLAGAWTKREGYATNELTGEQIDGRDLWSSRLSLRVQPTDRFDVNLIWEHFEENDDRLRSGKQLCKKDVVTEVAGIPVNYFQGLPDRGQAGVEGVISTVQSAFSQGCERASLYSPDIFQTPNGQSIPYYFQLGQVGLPTALRDPYVSETQTPDLRVIESTIDPKYRADADIGELQVSFDLTDDLTLSSETAYGVDSVYSLQDFNRFNTAPGAWIQGGAGGVLQPGPNGGIFCDPQLGCSDRLIAVDISTAEARQFSQEFRLSSNFDGPLNFSLGANYLRADSKDKYYVFINSLSLVAEMHSQGGGDGISCLDNGYGPGNPNGVYPVNGCIYTDPNPIESVNDRGHNYFLSNNPYKLISYAMFGEAYYQVTDALKVTAGLRWTTDKKDAPRVPTWVLTSESAGYPVAEVIEQEWREPTGRLTIDWKPDLSFTDETMIYGSLAHGYKAGGANPPGFVRIFYVDPRVGEANSASSATRPKMFDAEFVDALEVGTKNTLAGGAVTLNLAAFYYDYKDYQISEIVDRSAFNRNFDATVWGVELEADWRPLDNLRLGLKGGYEKTRIADGEQAVDLMDRTAGNEDWLVVRPFPTLASSCVLPAWLYTPTGGGGALWGLGGPNGGGPGGCEIAYTLGLDPVTEAPYVANPTGSSGSLFKWTPGTYPGFDPTTAPNNGEGFYKQLGGNELPNAPNWTATITADYTIPLPNDWLATLHTDLHWQSESWWRVFNDHEYDKLDEYFTMNLAAIFTNEEAGWKVMAYIKNVTDETAITGAFLNSDDTGLTTNVFLTEPRLYGLRVTKDWSGGSLFGSFNGLGDGPHALTVELSGQAQRHDAPNTALRTSFADEFPGPLNVDREAQAADLDWGDGRAVRLTYRPTGSAWQVAAAARFGKTNGAANFDIVQYTDPVCVSYSAYLCDFFASDPKYDELAALSRPDNVQVRTFEREEHDVVDFSVGRDIGFGGLSRSTLFAGVRYAKLTSATEVSHSGVPDWYLPEGLYDTNTSITRTVFSGRSNAEREFEGYGPTVTWDAAYPLLQLARGKLDIDWSVSGGVLFGDRETVLHSEGASYFVSATPFEFFLLGIPPSTVTQLPTLDLERSSDVTAPVADASVGLSYTMGGFRLGAGYRWERYFDALDVGYEEAEDGDRTIDGPYFTVSLGFGG